MKPKPGKTRAQALNLLLARLRDGKLLFLEGRDGGRQGTIHALNAILEFLVSFEEPLEESLLVPLVSLASALNDLEHGTVAPVLKTTRGAGLAPESTTRKGVRAVAVLTLELLRKTSLTQADAATMVATELNRCSVQLLSGRRRKLTATTIINWRKSISADFKKGFAAEVFEGMKLKNEINPQKPVTEVRADLLKRLRVCARTFRAQDEMLPDIEKLVEPQD